jgi:hypothetical protein
MENLYIWLLVFGGASLLLLGTFVFASDRRSGKHQGQVDASRHKHRFSQIQPGEKLREKVPSRLSGQGEEGQSMVEKLQTGQTQLAGARCDNDELRAKIANLIRQLHANERRLSESTREIQRVSQRNLKLETEVSHLKQQLKASQARQQQSLDQLQTTRSLGNEELSAPVDATPHASTGGQQSKDELRTARNGTKFEHPFRENHQPPQAEATKKKISQPWQEKRALRNDNEKQAGPLGARADALQEKETSLDSHFSRTRKLAVPSLRKRNRPLGIISTTAAIAIVGLATGLVRTGFDNDAENVSQGASVSAARSPLTILETSTSSGPGMVKAIREPTPKITEAVDQAPPTSALPLLRGAFETIRPTGLFTGPSEESALIRTLAAGTKIDVINSRDGWLEVRSKHTPSGFLRQEAAVKVNEHQS